MPIKNDRRKVLWNFYIDPLEKAQYIVTLKQNGFDNAASAGLRALMHLYINDQDVQNKLNSIIKDFTIFNSKL